MFKLDWKVVEQEGQGQNPMLNVYEAQIGEDANGRVWSARTKFRTQDKRFMVWFDNDDRYDVDVRDLEYPVVDIEDDDPRRWSTPFLRTEVLYAKDYWRKHKEFYSTEWCNYEDIQKVVKAFALKYNLTQ